MITFCHHSNGPGGVQTLILTLISEFSKKKITTRVIDIEGSYLDKAIKNTNLKYCTYLTLDNISNKDFKNDDVLVIFSFKTLWSFRKFKNRIIFWNVFPSTFSELNRFWGYPVPIYTKYLNKLLVMYLIRSKSIIFMDGAGIIDLKEQYNLQVSKSNILPLPLPMSQNEYIKCYKKKQKLIRISYVARSVIWKWFPLKKIISDALRYDNSYKIIINVYSDSSSYYKKKINIDFKYNVLNLYFYDNLKNNDLLKSLLNNTDIFIGMGYSCLQASSLGIPSVIIDPSYDDFPKDYKYKWIYETQNYCLGDFKKYAGDNLGTWSFDDLMRSMHTNSLMKKISKNCFEYAVNKHDAKKIIRKLLYMQKKASAQARKLSSYLIKNILRNII